MAATLASFLLAVAFLMTHPVPVAAQTVPTPASATIEPIRYTLSFPAPQTHYVEVSAVVPTARARPWS